MDLINSLNILEDKLKSYIAIVKRYKQVVEQGDFDTLTTLSENGLKKVSLLHLSHRDFLLSLYDLLPCTPHRAEIIETDALQITVNKMAEFDFPVYKITLPYLMPNKRERKSYYKNAITNTVANAVDLFCKNNEIDQFNYATVFFVSSYENQSLNVDNDNKEVTSILNGLIGRFIVDDRASSCDIAYHYQKIDSGAKTEVYISDTDDFMSVYNAVVNYNISN